MLSLRRPFQITPQPSDTSCGPSCLHSVYAYYGCPYSFEQITAEVDQFDQGGTLAVLLGLDALRRGYTATIYTCNLQLFDPTWFTDEAPSIRERIAAQIQVRDDHKLCLASQAYLDFLDKGGRLFMEDITPELVAELLAGDRPIITGLSATWLYRCMRERPHDNQSDDIAGESTGHFVVITGVDQRRGVATLADPYLNLPFPGAHYYEIDVYRLIGSILLGIVTYDAKLLVIDPPARKDETDHAHPDGGQ